MKHTTIALLFAAASACSGSGFQDGGDSEDNRDETGAAELAPGTLFVTAMPTSRRCGLESATMELRPTELAVSADGGALTLEDSDGLERIDCTAAGKSRFRCTASDRIDLGAFEVDVTTDLDMRWTSPDRFEAAAELTMICVSGDCSAFEPDFSFPCTETRLVIGNRTLPDKFVPQAGDYVAMVGPPLFTTCDAAPAVAPEQALRIVAEDDTTALVFADGNPVPHECEFEGAGRATCSRLVADETRQLITATDVSWTSGTRFEGAASLLIECTDTADCSDPALGNLPCFTAYHVSGEAAGAAD